MSQTSIVFDSSSTSPIMLDVVYFCRIYILDSLITDSAGGITLKKPFLDLKAKPAGFPGGNRHERVEPPYIHQHGYRILSGLSVVLVMHSTKRSS